MIVEKDAVVAIQYELRNSGGDLLDASSEDNPLVYLHGAGALLPALENELAGKSAGESLSVVIAPGEGYGEADDRLVQQVPREVFGDVEQLEVGMQFQTTGQNGETRVISISAVADDEVTIDANHPLAGVTLHFSVGVDSVRAATPEELEHGHAH